MPETRNFYFLRCIINRINDAVWRVNQFPQRFDLELGNDPANTREVFQFAKLCYERMTEPCRRAWIVLRYVLD